MAISNLFGDDDVKARVRSMAHRVSIEGERFVAGVDALKAVAASLSAEDKATLQAWFIALKQDLASRI